MKDNNIENLFQKGKTEKPPASLDNFILAQAKNSCDEKQSSATKSKRNRWLFSVSSAAVVVLSFSVIFNLQNENSQISDQPMILERSSNENKIDKEENDSSFKRSAKKVINDPVPESPLVVTEAESVEMYEESAESQAPVASGLSTQDTNHDVNTNNRVETKPVARSLPKAITPVPKKAMDEISFKREVQTPVIQTPKITQSIENELQESYYSTPIDDSEKLDNITVTGSRLMRKPISDVEATENSAKENNQEISFTQQLEQLDDFIKDKKLEEAKQLLMQLQKSYPYYDFSKYKDL